MRDPSINIGDWYLDRDKHDFLCVIAVHPEEGVVDIRDEYGDIDEIEFDEWETMDLVLCSTPDEWKHADHADDDWEVQEDGTMPARP